MSTDCQDTTETAGVNRSSGIAAMIGIPRVIRSLPIFDEQARNSTKFASVVTHECDPIREGDSGDQKIVWTDRHTDSSEVCSHAPRLFPRPIIEGK